MRNKHLLTRDDLNQPDFFQNPYPYYAELRSRKQPIWLPHDMGTSTDGIWLFSRHEDGLRIFNEAAAVSKDIRAARPPGSGLIFDLNMLHRDGSDHLRLRRLVSEFFSARAVERLRPVMAEVTETLLAELGDKTEFDFIADFAEPMPLRVIARLIGVPDSDMGQIRAWSQALSYGFDSLISSPAVAARQRQAWTEFLAYIVRLVATKRGRIDETLLSFLVEASEGGQLDGDELAAMVAFLLFAGHETTVDLIGNGLWLLLSHPQQWRLLCDDPALMPGAVEEILRFESPEQRTSFRLVKAPMDINGVIVETGQQIGVIIGSVNRDEVVFERPEVFDIQRTPNPHLAFGRGLHNCLGKALARTEAMMALTGVLAHMPGLRLTQGAPDWRLNSFFRGLHALPVSAQGA